MALGFLLNAVRLHLDLGFQSCHVGRDSLLQNRSCEGLCLCQTKCAGGSKTFMPLVGSERFLVERLNSIGTRRHHGVFMLRPSLANILRGRLEADFRLLGVGMITRVGFLGGAAEPPVHIGEFSRGGYRFRPQLLPGNESKDQINQQDCTGNTPTLS